MKLALVGELPGGHGYDLTRLGDALVGRGHKVHVFTATVPAMRYTPAGAAVQRLPVDTTGVESSEDLMPLIGEMGRHLVDVWEADGPDVVHCHGWVYGMAAQLAARRCRIPTVQSFPELSVSAGGDRGEGLADKRIQLEALLARNATAVTVACSDDMREIIRLGCTRAKASVLAPGIDVDDVCAEEIVFRHGESSGRVVAVARDFSPQQGLGQVLRVFPSSNAAELVLVTREPDDGPDYDDILSLAREKKAAKRVNLVAGAAGDDLTTLFRSADVVVAPARYEPSCATVLQAMACGAPIVATSAGGARDAVIGEVTGLLVPPGNADALGRALRSTLGQMVLREGMGLAGRSRARSRYSWDRIATDAEVVYASAATREAAFAC